MASTTEKRLLGLKKILYPNNEEAEKIDKTELKKAVYETLKEVIKLRFYQFNIGCYYFDITPQNLSVIYETPDTRIEVSNFDVHYETTRQTEKRYFVISKEQKDTYPENTQNIEVVGNIIQYDDLITTEQYVFTLNSNVPEDNIRKYLRVPNGCELYDDETYENPRSIVIGHDINRNDQRTDVKVFFNSEDIRSVYYDYPKHIFKTKAVKLNEDYKKYIPTLNRKKEIVSTIYSNIIDFYNEYQNK